MIKGRICLSVTLASFALLGATAAKADNTSAAAPVNLPMPEMAGPLSLNTNPLGFNAGPLGKIYVDGVLTALGMAQDHADAGDKNTHADISNGLVFLQNMGSPVQFYLLAGTYSLPALGTAYLRSSKTTSDTYGYVPEAYLKYNFNSALSVQAGKLDSLIGDEQSFTFQNMNVEGGLLANQESTVSRGIQGNYVAGPWALNLSWNDGFYSDHYTWLTGLATYMLDKNDKIAFDAGGNLGHSDRSDIATPKAQDNSSIYNLMYTHTDGPWTYNPYLQYTHVAKSAALGFGDAGETYGAAFLAKYAFDESFSLSGRAEYTGSTGNAAAGAPNLLYGPGSRAMSLTLTPTYKFDMLFARTEASYTHATKITDSDAFGTSGDVKSQARVLFETGITF